MFQARTKSVHGSLKTEKLAGRHTCKLEINPMVNISIVTQNMFSVRTLVPLVTLNCHPCRRLIEVIL